MSSTPGRLRTQTVRVLMLGGLLLLSGTAIGLAAAYPLTFINYDDSSAVRLDQPRLAGQVDVDAAVVSLDDLPKGWEPGDPALGGYGILNSQFCTASSARIIVASLLGQKRRVFALSIRSPLSSTNHVMSSIRPYSSSSFSEKSIWRP